MNAAAAGSRITVARWELLLAISGKETTETELMTWEVDCQYDVSPQPVPSLSRRVRYEGCVCGGLCAWWQHVSRLMGRHMHCMVWVSSRYITSPQWMIDWSACYLTVGLNLSLSADISEYSHVTLWRHSFITDWLVGWLMPFIIPRHHTCTHTHFWLWLWLQQ